MLMNSLHEKEYSVLQNEKNTQLISSYRYLLSTSSQDTDCYSVTPEHASCIKLNNQTKTSKTGSGL